MRGDLGCTEVWWLLLGGLGREGGEHTAVRAQEGWPQTQTLMGIQSVLSPAFRKGEPATVV